MWEGRSIAIYFSGGRGVHSDIISEDIKSDSYTDRPVGVRKSLGFKALTEGIWRGVRSDVFSEDINPRVVYRPFCGCMGIPGL